MPGSFFKKGKGSTRGAAYVPNKVMKYTFCWRW
uniref:Uncharacterized protein n=1 Tax=Arundo donax TaxID=35708 RepID=A0A0A9CRS0_ARUDO